MAVIKLNKERKQWAEKQKEDKELANVTLVDSTGFKEWKIQVVAGPLTPYAGRTIDLLYLIPEHYPGQPPVLKVTSKIYHMNIDPASGIVRMPMLTPQGNDSWAMGNSFHDVAKGFSKLLGAPLIGCGHEAMVEMYKKNPAQYIHHARNTK